MRILQMIDEMRLGGGAEQLQCSFAEAVQDTGVEVVVLTLHENEPAAAAELTARGQAVRALAERARRSVSPAPTLGIPDASALGPVPGDPTELTAYLQRLERVERALSLGVNLLAVLTEQGRLDLAYRLTLEIPVRPEPALGT